MKKDSQQEPLVNPEIHSKHQDSAAAVAQVIDKLLPEGVGFALLVFDMESEGYMSYISNAKREDMLVAMKEFIARHEGTYLRNTTSQ